MQEINLRGIIPAIVTPMTREGDLDLPTLRRYAQWLAEQGPVALAVNVDTGEGPHLTADEKRQTLETVAEGQRLLQSRRDNDMGPPGSGVVPEKLKSEISAVHLLQRIGRLVHWPYPVL